MIADKELYNKVKRMADKKFESKTGIYKSSWIVKEYKRLGGKYKGKKPSTKSPGLKRWYEEKWVDLNRPIKNSKGKVIGYKSCGRKSTSKNKYSSKNKYPLCRPSKRITSKTPRTYKEISKKSISKAKLDKSKVKGTKNITFGGATGGKAQYYGKRSSVMIPVPTNVKKTALYSFKLKKLGFKGGVETGWKRAKQLATKESIPIEDLKYMRAWFARHIITSYPTYKKWKLAGRPKDSSWHNRRGIISWLIWSGDAGFKWVNSQKNINLLNKHFGKNYKSMSISQRGGFDKTNTKFPRRMSEEYCMKTSCKHMGFSQKSSCRYYKNCYK